MVSSCPSSPPSFSSTSSYHFIGMYICVVYVFAYLLALEIPLFPFPLPTPEMVLQTYAIISASFMLSEALNACPHACVADVLPAKSSLDFNILYSALSFDLVKTVEIIPKQKSSAD